MGYIRHHGFLITSYDADRIVHARHKAIELGMCASEAKLSPINQYWSFAIFPDGSKEFWPDSDKGDTQRQQFVEWLEQQRYDDESTPIVWAEVQYGDEERDDKILNSSGKRPAVMPRR